MPSDVRAVFQTLADHNAAARRKPPLDLLEGNWSVSGCCRIHGVGVWLSFAGTAVGRWIMNDHYFHLAGTTHLQEYDHTAFWTACYDPLREEYSAFWIDDFANELNPSRGIFHSKNRILEETRRYPSPVTGRNETIRCLWDFNDPDGIVVTWHRREDLSADWSPFVETLYRRKTSRYGGAA